MEHSSTKPGARLPEMGLITFTVNGREVAEFDPASATLRKRIRGSKHMLQRPPALAWDVAIIEKAAAAGAEHVEVFDAEAGTTYRCALATLLAHGRRFDRGWGEQLALTLTRWRRDDEPAAAEQLSLFGMTP